jgi:ankyrin repeat protein
MLVFSQNPSLSNNYSKFDCILIEHILRCQSNILLLNLGAYAMSWQMTESQIEEARQRKLRDNFFDDMLAAVNSGDLKKIAENINQIMAEGWGDVFCSSAVKYGHSSIVQFFLKHNVKLSLDAYLKDTLRNATSKGYRKLTKFLLEAGADGRDCFMDSLSDTSDSIIKLETLIDCGINNIRITEDGYNYLTSNIAGFAWGSRSSLSMLKYLDYHNNRGASTRLLLKQGADLDKGTLTPLDLVKQKTHATKSGEQEIFRKLFVPYSIVVAAEDLFTIINVRAKDPTNPNNPNINKFKEILKFLDQGLQAKIEGNTALHVAVQKNDSACVALLLSAGANVDILNDQEKSPLHIALEKKDPYILCLCYIHHLRAKQDLAQKQENVLYDEKEEQELKAVSEVLAEIKKRKSLTNSAAQDVSSQSVKNKPVDSVVADVKDNKDKADSKENADNKNKADNKVNAEPQKFELTNEDLYQLIEKLNEKDRNECNAKLAFILANRNCVGIKFDPMKAYELLTHANTLVEQTEEDFKLANRALYRLLMLNDIKFDFVAIHTANPDVKSLDEDNMVSNASKADHVQKITVQRGTGDANNLPNNKELMRLRMRHLLQYAMHGGLQDEVSIGILIGEFIKITPVPGQFPDISRNLSKQKPYQIIPNLLLILADQCRDINECAENTKSTENTKVAAATTDAPKELMITQYENSVNSGMSTTKSATAASTQNVTRKNS